MLRRTVYGELDPSVQPHGLSLTNKVLAVLIVTATLLAVLATEPLLILRYGQLFAGAELVLGVIFLAEYFARLWSAPEKNHGARPWKDRLAFMTSPSGLADLLAIGLTLAPTTGSGPLLLRAIRLLRILRIAKLGRLSQALRQVSDAVASRRYELLVSLSAGLLLMLLAAVLLYLVEGPGQPDKFGSIPRALWWAVATLTTVGYGDVFPLTPLGKVLAGVTAVIGIGLVAMPTGILAAAFSEAVQKNRSR